MLGQRFTELVDICLQRLDQGEDLLDILADYPDYQERIKPLLLVAMASRAFPVPIPHQTAKRMGKNNLLAEMAQMEGEGAFRKSPRIPSQARFFGKLGSSLRSTGFTRPVPNFRLAMIVLIMIFGAGFYTLNASAGGYSGEFINYLSSSYQYVLEVLSFDVTESDELPFGEFHFFSGKGLGFNNQVAQKVALLLDIEDEEESYLPPEEDGQKKNQNRNGDDQEGMAGSPANNPQDQEDNGLALGHEVDQDNEGLALGLDKDQENPGLALGLDKDEDDPGLALGLDKDKDNSGKALGHDKVFKDKLKDKDDGDDQDEDDQDEDDQDEDDQDEDDQDEDDQDEDD